MWAPLFSIKAILVDVDLATVARSVDLTAMWRRFFLHFRDYIQVILTQICSDFSWLSPLF